MKQTLITHAGKACLMATVMLQVAVLDVRQAYAAGLGDIDAGQAYAERRCAECHDISARNPMTTATGAPTFHQIANAPGVSHTSLSAWLLSSHPKMPGLMIERSDLDDVITFILSLKDN